MVQASLFAEAMNGACFLFLACGTVEEVAYLQSVVINFLQQFSNRKCHWGNNHISQAEQMPSMMAGCT